MYCCYHIETSEVDTYCVEQKYTILASCSDLCIIEAVETYRRTLFELELQLPYHALSDS